VTVDVEAAVLRMIEAAVGVTLADLALRTGHRDSAVLDVLLGLQARGLVRAERETRAQPRRWFAVASRAEEAL